MVEADENARTEEVLEDGSIAWRPLVLQFLVAVIGAGAAVAGASWLLQDPIEAASHAFVASTGLVGVFVSVLVIDVMLLTHEPILLAAWVGGVSFWPIVLTASAASILAGPIGWWCGGHLGKIPAVARLLQRYKLDAFLRRYGLVAIAIAAITPVPYGPTVWAAGASGVPLRDVVLGSLLRFPKVLFWGWVVVSGWAFGVSIGD